MATGATNEKETHHMRKTIAAVLVGAAFVAGGFFAGTLGDSDLAVAQEGDTAVGPPAEGALEGRALRHRGPLRDMLQSAAEFLEMEPREVVEALADGTTLAELTEDDAGLVSAIVDAAEAAIDQAVEDGKLDAERAEEIKAELDERVETFVSTPHERGDHPRPGDRHVRGFVKQAAEVIGIDVADLVAGIQDGMSIADVAAENGMSEDTLIAELTDLAQERIAEAVTKTK